MNCWTRRWCSCLRTPAAIAESGLTVSVQKLQSLGGRRIQSSFLRTAAAVLAYPGAALVQLLSQTTMGEPPKQIAGWTERTVTMSSVGKILLSMDYKNSPSLKSSGEMQGNGHTHL